MDAPYPLRHPYAAAALLAALYFLAARLGLSFSVVGESVSLIWPPTGLALVALLLFGPRLWPGIALGALLANLATDVPLATAVGIAIGNTLEALCGAYLLRTIPGFTTSLERVRDVLGLIFLAAAGSTAVSASIGTLSLTLGGVITWEQAGLSWLIWWMGDAMGNLVFAPVLLILASRIPRLSRVAGRWFEALILAAGLLITNLLIFTEGYGTAFPSAYLIFPLAIWAALRFGPRGAALAVLLTTIFALAGTLRGEGPFVGNSTVESLSLLWLFANALAITSLVLAAALIERKRAKRSSQDSNQRYHSLVQQSPDGIFLFDPATGELLEANTRFLAMAGLEADSFNRSTVSALALRPTLGADADLVATMQSGPVMLGEYRLDTALGKTLELELSASLITLAGKQVAMINARDITLRKQSEADLRLGASVFHNATEAILVTDAQCRIISANKAFTQLTGYALRELLGQNPRILRSGHHEPDFYKNMWQAITERGHWQGEIWDRRKDGEIYPKWLSINAIKDGSDEITHYVGIATDISERKMAEARIRHLAQHDALTGLPNRLLLQDHAEQALRLARRHGYHAALFFIDLDRFKNINDTLGHKVGDSLLEQVAARLLACVREEDTVARQGGDEFVIVLNELAEPRAADLVAKKILESFLEPIRFDGNEFHISPSIGISVFPGDGDKVDTLMKNADIAMYQAKRAGGNCHHYYTREMNVRAFERLNLENALRYAVDKQELSLHYQPQLDLGTGTIVGVEALARWHHPQMGAIPPDLFIPIAEECGLIVPLGEWVLRESCKQIMRWRAAGHADLRIAVNLSARQFSLSALPQHIAALLSELGTDPAALELEVTESVLMQHTEDNVATLNQLHHMGMLIAMDDFGTGHSSLSYLKRFPIDKLKIDRAFIRGLPQDADDAAIATAIIAMARSLKLSVIAEGVETDEQLQFLRDLNCDGIQGYHLSRPLPAAECGLFLDAHAHRNREKPAYPAQGRL